MAEKPGEETSDPLSDGTAAGGMDARDDPVPESAGNIDDMLSRLAITAEEEEEVDLSGLIEEHRAAMKWAVIIKVCLKTSFSHTAFYQKMQVAWAVAQEVSFRDLDDFTFIAQFKCLGDWRTAMHGGPWLFRCNAVVIEEYDGLVNTETIPLDSIRVWISIMGLPDLVRNPAVARTLAGKIGQVIEVEMGTNGVKYTKFVRVYVRINLKKPLLRWVTGNVDPGKKAQKFRVLYEKMPRFCAICGVIGHVADECGDGSHDPKDFQYGDFMMVPEEDFWYQPKKEYVIRPQSSNIRGRGGRGRGGRTGPSQEHHEMDEDGSEFNENIRNEKTRWLKKRNMGVREEPPKSNALAIIASSHVANVVEAIEGKSGEGISVGETTPQKVQVQKGTKLVVNPLIRRAPVRSAARIK
jgi:hypothetical protein